MAEEHLISVERLTAVTAAIVRAGGSSDAEAMAVATNLVEANLQGHDSHGVGMIPRYSASLREGGLKVNAQPAIKLDTGSLLVVDGNMGYGQVIGEQSMRWAIERARKHGVCVLALSNSHHIGRIGHWAEMATAAGLVSVHFVNVISRPIVAPWGGRDARHGTNPFCVGVPRRDRPPIILDFATSRIAQGKTRVAHNKRERLAEGTIIDADGNPTTDPRFTVIEPFGAILPFGEHKGSGLALVCELLGGALTGGPATDGRGKGEMRIINNMLAFVVDADKLGTRASFEREAEAYLAWHTASPPAAGVDRVKIAGEPERERKRERSTRGIAVDVNTWKEMLAAAEHFGLSAQEVNRMAGLAA
jgi:hydroxycarboxylate dehydrogenase B